MQQTFDKVIGIHAKIIHISKLVMKHLLHQKEMEDPVPEYS